jgi:hypothetical protein
MQSATFRKAASQYETFHCVTESELVNVLANQIGQERCNNAPDTTNLFQQLCRVAFGVWLPPLG